MALLVIFVTSKPTSYNRPVVRIEASFLACLYRSDAVSRHVKGVVSFSNGSAKLNFGKKAKRQKSMPIPGLRQLAIQN